MRRDSIGGATKAYLFWPATVLIVALDVVTKYFAHTTFGLHLGPASRWIFLAITAGALVILGRLYRQTPSHDRLRALALGLVCGGAAGNLINRIWSARGVVDFIDVGIGHLRWPTFNVADIGVSTGAILLAWVLWAEARRKAAATTEGGS